MVTPDARERISRAISRAESETSGEIVPLVVASSDRYAEAHWACASALAMTVLYASLEFVPRGESWVYVAAAIAGFVAGWSVAFVPFIKRWAVGRGDMERETLERATQAFYAHRVDRTFARTGVLIFVSLLEHRVVILADQGIHSRVAPGTWDQMVAALISEIRAGRWEPGLVQAIQECGKILKEFFPGQKNDPNELPDALAEEPIRP